MTPAARTQELIQILFTFEANLDLPADKLLKRFFSERRYIGSKDRQWLSENFFNLLRVKYTLDSSINLTSARLKVAAFLGEAKHFDGSRYGPAQLSNKEKLITKGYRELLQTSFHTPEWMIEEIKKSYTHYEQVLGALNHEAATDLRINPLKITRDQALKALEKDGIEASASRYSPLGIRLKKRVNLKQHKLFKDGVLEVQDEGAQIISLLADVNREMQVLDYCAGAGGKSLVLGAMMENKGTLIATDIHEWRLKRAKARLKNSGLNNVQLKLIDNTFQKRNKERFDCVYLDVPCSGSGTWRRNPDLRLKFQKSDLFNIIKTQKLILQQGAKLTKPGGKMIYATCSMFTSENQENIRCFLKEHDQFHLENITPTLLKHKVLLDLQEPCDMLQLNPHDHQTDGFFACVLVRKT